MRKAKIVVILLWLYIKGIFNVLKWGILNIDESEMELK